MRTVTVLSLLLAACGGSDPAAPDAGSSDAAEYVDCGDFSADVFRAGMTRTGPNGATIDLLSAVPAPPARFDNAWVVRSPSGSISQVTSWMPAHGHGAQKPAVVTATGDPDQYSIDPIDLWMPGMWEVRIDVPGDRVTFRFCIAE
jgi:hypothetical protein